MKKFIVLCLTLSLFSMPAFADEVKKAEADAKEAKTAEVTVIKEATNSELLRRIKALEDKLNEKKFICVASCGKYDSKKEEIYSGPMGQYLGKVTNPVLFSMPVVGMGSTETQASNRAIDLCDKLGKKSSLYFGTTTFIPYSYDYKNGSQIYTKYRKYYEEHMNTAKKPLCMEIK